MFAVLLGVFIEMYVYTRFHHFVTELHAHLCPYRSVWPEAVYCCFTRTTLFTLSYYMVVMDIHVSIHKVFSQLCLVISKTTINIYSLSSYITQ